MLTEKIPDERRDLVAIRFQGEVTRVEEMELQCLQVSFIRFSAVGREDFVILAPGDQHRRLVLAEVVLPLRIKREVTAVAQKQVELDFIVPLSIEQKLVV